MKDGEKKTEESLFRFFFSLTSQFSRGQKGESFHDEFEHRFVISNET